MNFTKRMFLLTTVLFFVVNAYSQEPKVSIGAKLGLNLSNVDAKSLDTDAKIGYQFGMVAEYNLPNNFFLRSGLDFQSKGFRFDMGVIEDINGDGYLDSGFAETSWNPLYLQIPVMAGYKVYVTNDFNINFTIGGYLAYGVGGKVTTKIDAMIFKPNGQSESHFFEEKTNVFADDLLNRFDAGLIGGIGADYKSFTFNLGYEFGLVNYSTGDGSIHNQNAFLSVGYRIF